jgi:hypothetical protein
MGPDGYVCRGRFNHGGNGIYQWVVQPESSNRHLFVYAATEPETGVAATTATCDFVVRLLATSNEDGAYIQGTHGVLVHISGPGLSRFFQESQDNLRKVTP